MSSKLHISVLASTSAGNCTVIWNNSCAILIDCGLGINRIKSNLSELGISISSLKGVFITHMHHDHVKTSPLKFFCKNNIPIFCHKDMKDAINEKFSFLKNGEKYGKLVLYDKNSIAGNFFISAFDVPHDSQGGCKGFNIFSKVNGKVKKISVSTDLASTDKYIIKRFSNSDVIIIESNHDLDMLENSKRSYVLKERIRNTGHLSNEQSSLSVSTILLESRRKAKNIILTHISQECNSNEIAVKCMSDRIIIIDSCDDIEIVETFKDTRSKTVIIE